MILGKYLGIVLQIGLVFIPAIKGHGILKEPPGRSSMWRFGFSNPTNYNDNQLYCGGRDVSILSYLSSNYEKGETFYHNLQHIIIIIVIVIVVVVSLSLV